MIRYLRIVKLVLAIIWAGEWKLLRDRKWIVAYGNNPRDLDPVP